jgi:hypothetical protein
MDYNSLQLRAKILAQDLLLKVDIYAHIEPEDSLPFSQKLAFSTYRQPVESS